MVHICIFDATIQEFTDKGVDLVSTLKGLGYEAFVTNVLVPPHNVSNYGDVCSISYTSSRHTRLASRW
ncbi:hypothetical protein NECAME_07712 [Necator americanus]|uniref:Uncharacterized protein n=1 Tax=Necator americanus TaxID=51031 RepID=W2TM97_NECAM|nr:hypothetical protein NECAME_07712 [Necator americanus]ETN82878.1 hypothetical protein NECAME_07712 [Necator americanus]